MIFRVFVLGRIVLLYDTSGNLYVYNYNYSVVELLNVCKHAIIQLNMAPPIFGNSDLTK